MRDELLNETLFFTLDEVCQANAACAEGDNTTSRCEGGENWLTQG